VDDRKGLVRATEGRGQQSHSSGKSECERSDHELRLAESIGARRNLKSFLIILVGCHAEGRQIKWRGSAAPGGR
jgi:hypothetical protein